MAIAASSGSGKTTIPPSAVDSLVRDATGLPSTFFVTTTKARVLADGSLEANYNFSNQSAPPPPVLTTEEVQPLPANP